MVMHLCLRVWHRSQYYMLKTASIVSCALIKVLKSNEWLTMKTWVKSD